MSAHDGGPAFPVQAYTDGLGFVYQPEGGMTQRAYIATKVLCGLVSQDGRGSPETVARDACMYADALLAQLEGRA